MAIQLGRTMEATVLVMVDSYSKVEFLGNQFQLSESEIIRRDDASSLNKIFTSTDGRGADVIIGPLPDEGYTELTHYLALFGRLNY
ncbi:hypothetical protein F4801DRAFT_546933 [Xylaria longipes]|nr:hypothetical protein F4801DRAFT_546933 [Xylaria longipes]